MTDSSDTHVWAMLKNEHDENIDVEFVMRKNTMSNEDWFEICLRNETPMLNQVATSAAPTASAVKRTEQCMDGTVGVDLCQVGWIIQNKIGPKLEIPPWFPDSGIRNEFEMHDVDIIPRN